MKKLKDMYAQYWNDLIHPKNTSSKMEFYGQLKTSIHFEKYLDCIPKFSYRQALTKIRISAHPLAIEYGRYSKPPIPRDQRLCETCNAVETEVHFLTDCTLYTTLRGKMFQAISSKCINFINLNNQNKAIFMLTNESKDTCCAVAKFCHGALETRKENSIGSKAAD